MIERKRIFFENHDCPRFLILIELLYSQFYFYFDSIRTNRKKEREVGISKSHDHISNFVNMTKDDL
jgi:hypothetical protein